MRNVYPIILAGGTGSRLWPLSRELYPKQFLKLYDDNSMLQATVHRVNSVSCHMQQPLVICNEEHRFLVAEQLREIHQLAKNIILEPVSRNTAPAITLAALTLIKDNPDAILFVLAADHLIRDEEIFSQCIERAVKQAESDKMVTFGIVPKYAETGYGYIHKGDSCGDAYFVNKFVEKPDAEIAERYFSSGEYLWNSGMFMFKASHYLAELEQFCPEVLQACQAALKDTTSDMDFVRVNQEQFAYCPNISVDYAVMEATKDAVVVPMNAEWSDVGSWLSLWEISEKDHNNNVVKGDVIAINSENNLIHSSHRLVSTVGVEDLIVVETADAVLVANKKHCQDIKLLINEIKRSKRTEHYYHREVFRPWGKYDSIDKGDRYQVKRISVKPGEKLSIQMHHHRAEHWIVVSGTAKVMINNQEQLVTENQSIYIPLGATHSLENPGKIMLDLIEIQSGSYLEEDDIVRFEDRYGRTQLEKN